MTPIESLDVLASILQQVSLPVVAPDGKLSHTIIAEHLQSISKALQPETEETEKEATC